MRSTVDNAAENILKYAPYVFQAKINGCHDDISLINVYRKIVSGFPLLFPIFCPPDDESLNDVS